MVKLSPYILNMSKHYFEIENFTSKEVTEMFNAICSTALQKDPIEVKKNLLGIKFARKDTTISLSHLMILIDKHKIPFSFKTFYDINDNIVDSIKHESIDIKDVLEQEMDNQNIEIPNFDL